MTLIQSLTDQISAQSQVSLSSVSVTAQSQLSLSSFSPHSNFSLSSVSAQSQLILTSVSAQSQLSLSSVSAQSQFSLSSVSVHFNLNLIFDQNIRVTWYFGPYCSSLFIVFLLSVFSFSCTKAFPWVMTQMGM